LLLYPFQRRNYVFNSLHAKFTPAPSLVFKVRRGQAEVNIIPLG